MLRERPLLVFLAAVINLVLGAFCVLAGCGGVGRWFFALTLHASRGALEDMSAYAHAHVPGALELGLANAVALLSGGGFLVLAGLGLLWMQPWARWLALLYALLTLGWQLLYAVLQVAWVWPATARFLLEMDLARRAYSPDEFWTFRLTFFSGLLLQVGVLGGHALALIVVLVWPSVGAAFATPTAHAPVSPESM